MPRVTPLCPSRVQQWALRILEHHCGCKSGDCLSTAHSEGVGGTEQRLRRSSTSAHEGTRSWLFGPRTLNSARQGENGGICTRIHIYHATDVQNGFETRDRLSPYIRKASISSVTTGLSPLGDPRRTSIPRRRSPVVFFLGCLGMQTNRFRSSRPGHVDNVLFLPPSLINPVSNRAGGQKVPAYLYRPWATQDASRPALQSAPWPPSPSSPFSSSTSLSPASLPSPSS